MADLTAKASSATPVGYSRSEGAEGAATDVLSDQVSSSSSKTRSSDINQESDAAAGLHEDFHGVSAQARTVEDVTLQSQDPRVCPQTTHCEGAFTVDRPEEVVTNDNGYGHGVSEQLLQHGLNLRIDTTLMETDQDDRPETPESILAVTGSNAYKGSRVYTAAFKFEVVEYTRSACPRRLDSSQLPACTASTRLTCEDG
jgi:hypothetical protein